MGESVAGEWVDVIESVDYNVENLNTNASAIILVGGLGERLQAVGLKPFLLCKGKSFLEIAVENVSSIQLNPVLIVTNHIFYGKIIAQNFPAKILINPHPEDGMLSSILIGLKEIESSIAGFFLCPIDYPLVEQATFHKLLLAHQSDPDKIITPACNGQSGHPIVFPATLFQSLREAPQELGARFVTRQFVHLTKTVEVNDPGILININTPGLYCQYCK
ncbi:MAG TPA: nucleotidyltransferase family protein [bacterium]